MFGLILGIIVLSSVVRLFTRPIYRYRRPPMYPFGGYGGWGMGMGMRPPHGPHHYGHHGGPHGPHGHRM